MYLTDGIQIGQYWTDAIFYVYNGYNVIESGNEHIVLHYLNRLKQLGEAFDNGSLKLQYHRLNVQFYVKFRKMDDQSA